MLGQGHTHTSYGKVWPGSFFYQSLSNDYKKRSGKRHINLSSNTFVTTPCGDPIMVTLQSKKSLVDLIFST